MKKGKLICTQDAAKVDALLSQAKPFAFKTAILRNNLFAHRSANLSYADAFKKAAVTPKQLDNLTELALKIANHFLIARGLSDHFFNPLPARHARAMLRALARSSIRTCKDKR
jgi:hypothetical protein